MGKYYIDGVDLETLGVFVIEGSDDFLRLPNAKERYSYSWPELDGEEVDLSSPVIFEPKDITIKMAIIANDESSFWNKYNSFISLIKVAGTKRMYVTELSRSFFVYFKAMNEFSRLTRILGGAKVCAKYTVTFTEPIPSLLKPYHFLTMQGGGYLLTNTAKIININP